MTLYRTTTSRTSSPSSPDSKWNDEVEVRIRARAGDGTRVLAANGGIEDGMTSEFLYWKTPDEVAGVRVGTTVCVWARFPSRGNPTSLPRLASFRSQTDDGANGGDNGKRISRPRIRRNGDIRLRAARERDRGSGSALRRRKERERESERTNG